MLSCFVQKNFPRAINKVPFYLRMQAFQKSQNQVNRNKMLILRNIHLKR